MRSKEDALNGNDQGPKQSTREGAGPTPEAPVLTQQGDAQRREEGGSGITR
jgi:hypothetical protein